MCNACGFICCAMDCFSQCGCECENPLCWEPDDDPFDEDEDEVDDDFMCKCGELDECPHGYCKNCETCPACEDADEAAHQAMHAPSVPIEIRKPSR